MNYLVSSVINEHMMFANMIDGLTEYDRYGVLKPSIAKSWTISPDGTVYTFKLREGVRWITSGGKDYAEVTAQDFVDGVKYVLSKDAASKVSDIVVSVLKNAPESTTPASSPTSPRSGSRPRTSTRWNTRWPSRFPTSSRCSPTSASSRQREVHGRGGKRFGTDNTMVLYNGAYIMDAFDPQSSRELVKNEKYWDKDNVFINRLRYKYNKESTTLGPELFLRGDVSGLESRCPSTSWTAG